MHYKFKNTQTQKKSIFYIFQIKRDLIELADPEILKSTFSVDNVYQLTEMKSISIQKLLDFAPPGTFFY